MRFLIVNPAYRPATGAITERVADLAEHLAGAGHDVCVLCWKDEGRREPAATQMIDGVVVVRIGGRTPGALAAVMRRLPLLWELIVAATLRRFDADVVITVAPPMPLAWFGRLHSLRRGGRSAHVAWVLDLESERTADKKRKWASLVRKLGKELLFAPIRDASLVVAIGRCMRETLVANRIAPSRIKVAPLWSNRNLIEPIERGASLFAADPELRGKFIVMYSGRAARYHEVETVCEAMTLLRDDADIAFVFAASDVGASYVEQYAAAHQLPNFHRRSNVGLKELGAFLGGADVHLVTLKNEMLGTCVPSKTYGAFAAARPVIFVGPHACETALNIIEHDAGRVVRVGDAKALASQIRAWKTRDEAYCAARENALRAFNASHCVEAGCGRMAALMLECVERHAAAPTRRRIRQGGQGLDADKALGGEHASVNARAGASALAIGAQAPLDASSPSPQEEGR